MIVNILHRPPERAEHYRLFRLQQEMVHGLNLKVTLLLDLPSMNNSAIVQDVRRDIEQFGDEPGIWFSSVADIAGVSKEPFIWLHAQPEKRRIFEIMFHRYRDIFGRDPESIGSYHFDAGCLRLIRELCPTVRIAVAGCFEEGVKVFHGCNNSWYLFNEGMPWGAWYPSKTHSLRPALDEADWSGIVAVPHLNRDLALSYEGRNDFFATHPANVQRAMAYRGSECPYMLNLVDQVRLQEEHNDGFSYCHVHVSAGWLEPNHNVPDPEAVSQGLYREFLEYFVALRRVGKCTDMTMGEFGHWHRKHIPVGKPTVALAKEMLYGTGKHYVWYADGSMRVLLDTTQGGSIGDLRPYVGQVAVETGPDTPHTIYGSYPYLIHSQYRSGMAHHFADGARTTLFVSCNGETMDLGLCPTRVAELTRSASGVRVRLTPARVAFANGVRLSIETEFLFAAGGTIRILRRLAELSDPNVEVRIREYFKGCWGITEYPERMKGIQLAVDGASKPTLAYDDQGRTIRSEAAQSVRARVPQVQTEVMLDAGDEPALLGTAIEGFLFNPYYTLSLDKCLKPDKAVTTWLRMTRIP